MSEMMQIHASLLDSSPPIWRKLILDPRLTLEQCHRVLQIAFGWTDSHLHHFLGARGKRYALPSPFDDDFDLMGQTHDARKYVLRDVFSRRGQKLTYEYDFGDSWLHELKYEGMVDPETLEYPVEAFVVKSRGSFSGKPRAASCIAGQRNGPPEDCGGVFGLERIVELKTGPHRRADISEEDAELLDWLGDWDPEHFNLAEINQNLGRIRVKKACVDR